MDYLTAALAFHGQALARRQFSSGQVHVSMVDDTEVIPLEEGQGYAADQEAAQDESSGQISPSQWRPRVRISKMIMF